VAFESKRLYVQLPCEGTSRIEEGVAIVPPGFCPYPSIERFVPVDPVGQCVLVSDVPADVRAIACGGATRNELGNVGSVLVTPETLAILRRQIETRLAMVKDAQQAIASRTATSDEGVQ
jgi:hypothetical protein